MKRILYVALVILLCNSALATDYYVRTNAQGSKDGSSWSNAWDISKIDWGDIYSDLSSDDVNLFFKRGDVFSGQLNIFGSRNVDSKCVNNYPHNGPNRFYLGVDPTDTGPKPRIVIHVEPGERGKAMYWCNAGYITIDNFDMEDTGYDAGEEDLFRSSSAISIGQAGSGTSPYNLASKGHIHFTNNDFAGFGRKTIAIINSGDYLIVEGNTFTNCGAGAYYVDESDDGGSYHYFADNICDNIFQEVHSDGKGYDGHCWGPQRVSNSIFENNIAYDNAAPTGFWVGDEGDQDDNVIRNNIIIRSVTSVHLSDSDIYELTHRNRWYGNIIADAASKSTGTLRSAFRFNMADGGSYDNANRFFHNTIYGAIYDGIGLRRGTDYSFFYNNIVHGTKSGHYYVKMTDTDGGKAPMGPHNKFDYNLYDSDKADGWTNPGGGKGNFGWWQNDGYDINAPDPADPKLVNPSNEDYSLSTGSPAIDKGGYLSFVDYSGDGSKSGQSEIKVDDPYWFHDNYGIKKADGTPVSGMLVTFYDTTNGNQPTEIMDVDYSGKTITVSPDVNYIYDNSAQKDASKNTQVSLRFNNNRPDIGAIESGSTACSCNGKECGDDGCGNSCGSCGAGESCNNGLCIVQNGDIIAHWQMGTSTDNSGNGNSLSVHGNPQIVSGKIGDAYLLDGIDDYLSAADSITLDFEKTSGTITMWVKPESPGANRHEILLMDSDFEIEFNTNYAQPYYYPYADHGTWDNYYRAETALNTSWQHVAVSWDYTNKEVILYINGVEQVLDLEGTPGNWNTIANTADWHIGGSPVKPGEYFKGVIDEVRIYNIALNPQEIMEIFKPTQ